MYRRLFAMILAFVMVFSMLPGTALATDGTPETEPAATEAQETEPKETEPKETEPKETEPKATEAKETEPKETEPKETEPKATEAKETEPKETEPKETEPKETEPVVTEPVVTEPEETEPQATQPVETQPAPDQKVKFTNPGKRNAEELATVKVRFSFEFPEDSGLPGDKELSSYIQLTSGLPDNPTRYVAPGIPEEDDTDRKVSCSFLLPANETYAVEILTVDFEGYHRVLVGDSEIDLIPGDNGTKEYTVRYLKDEEEDKNTAKLSIVLSFAEDSAFQDADIRDIIVVAENLDTHERTGADLTTANGRTAELILPAGDYEIRFNGYNKKEGYSCSITGGGYVSLSAGEHVTQTHTIRYVKEEGKLTVSLVFAEDSAFGDADIGDITVTVKSDYGDEPYSKVLTGANGRTAEFTIPSGTYYTVSFSGYEKAGYLCGLEGQDSVYCRAGEEIAKTYTVKYVKDEAKLAVSFAFASDSDLQDADIGDITVTVENRKTNETVSAVLTTANGRTAELTLPSGSYTVSFSGYEKEDYLCSIDNNAYVSCDPGAEVTRTYTAKYVKDEAKLTVSLDFAWNSVLQDADIGDITVTVENQETGKTESAQLTSANGRTAEFTLPSGGYTISFSGYEKAGYRCGLEGQDSVYCGAEEEVTKTYPVKYVKNEAKLTVSLVFAEESVFGDADIGDITVTVSSDTKGTYSEVLTGENGRTAELTLPTGYYTISFSGYEKPDHSCTLEKNSDIWIWNPGTTNNVNREVRYDSKEATLSVELTFAKDSDLSGADIGNIVAEIYEVPTSGDDKLIDTLTLSEENGWKAEFTVPAAVKESRNRLEGEFTYKLKLSGTEKEGYRSQFTGADYTITPLPGKKDGWNAVAKYMEAENSVTVKVRLSEDSNMYAYKLKDALDLGLADITGGTVDESGIIHTGSEVFTHTFADLPDSDCYRLNVSVWEEGISVQSFSCTGNVKYEDLEEGQLDFVPDGDCEIEVVLLAKEPKGEVTVIARFADDSILQAEDFPNGLTLTPVHEQYRESQQLGNALLVSPGNNWTAMTTITTRMSDMVVEQPDGYVGSVELSDIYGDPIESGLSPAACPTTVYAEICFTEHEPAYLDVEFVFAEDSALKGADAGSIYLDVGGSTNDRIEFSEQSGWKRTLELYGTYNGFEWDCAYGFAVSGLDRPGYSYSLEKDGFPLRAEDSVEWCGMGAREELIITVRYTRLPNALVVNTTSSPYGERPDSTIVVEDADGNIVAERLLLYRWGAKQIIELSEAGYYTVRLVKEESTGPRIHLIDEEKTIYFDPAVGACVTFLSEIRVIMPLKLRKYFTEDSELGPNDFPEGIKVTLTEATGAFSGTYTLSDANGWQMDVNVPVGSYTVTETEADKEGYERTTEYTFHYWGELGGTSLRGWSNRADSEGAGETVTDMTGGPFFVRSQTEVNEIFIYNTYVSDRTGSITITAGDGFWLYGGEQLPGSLDTGYEAEEYEYLVVINGEEQTISLKPGETFELDGLEEGTEYTVTPVLPDGYPWNTDVTPITGTIGGEDEDDWNVEVSFENDYYYTYEDGTLTVVKTDALTDETLKGAKFGLYADKDCTEQVATATTNKDGICSFTLTGEGTYYLKELKAPEDYYVKSEKVKTVTVTGEWKLETREGTKVLVQKLTASVAGLSQKDGGYIWENERKTTDISVTKIFAHDEDLERPAYVIAVLYRDGEAYDWAKLSADNNWNYVWKDMPLGFEYTVDEADVPEGYYKQVRSDGYDFTIINSGTIIPQTGDESQMMFWCAGAMLSLCAIVFLTEKKRRAQNN